MPKDKNLPAHHVEKGNPKIDGPYLDDIQASKAAARRNIRMKQSKNEDKKIAEATQSIEDKASKKAQNKVDKAS